MMQSDAVVFEATFGTRSQEHEPVCVYLKGALNKYGGRMGRPTCWPINNPGRPVGPGGGWVSFRGCLGQMPPWPFGLKSKPPLKGDSFSQQQAAALRAKSGPNMAASLQKESYKDDTLIIQFLRDILTSSTSDDAGDA